MAYTNVIKLTGLTPVDTLTGARWSGKGNVYCIPSTDSTYNYFTGDLVAPAVGGDTNGIPYISLCAAGATAVGVIQAIGTAPYGPWVVNYNNLQAPVYAPITKTQNYYALVIDDPNVIFEICEGSSVATTNLTSAVCNLNANIAIPTQSTTAAVTAYLSGMYLDNHTAPTTTSTYNLRIIRLAQRADNHFVTNPATGGGGQRWWVTINNHTYRGGVTAP